MQLDDLKKSMSTLDQILAKTNVEIQINVSACETAKSRILKKFRQEFTSYIILAIIFAVAAYANINPQSFPNYLKIFLVVLLSLAAIWNVFMYGKLRHINIATLTPAKLISETAHLKLLALSGEIIFGMGLVVFFTLLFPNAWQYHRFGFWAMAIGLILALIYSVAYYWPKYVRLFRDLNSIKE